MFSDQAFVQKVRTPTGTPQTSFSSARYSFKLKAALHSLFLNHNRKCLDIEWLVNEMFLMTVGAICVCNCGLVVSKALETPDVFAMQAQKPLNLCKQADKHFIFHDTGLTESLQCLEWHVQLLGGCAVIYNLLTLHNST